MSARGSNCMQREEHDAKDKHYQSMAIREAE